MQVNSFREAWQAEDIRDEGKDACVVAMLVRTAGCSAGDAAMYGKFGQTDVDCKVEPKQAAAGQAPDI